MKGPEKFDDAEEARQCGKERFIDCRRGNHPSPLQSHTISVALLYTGVADSTNNHIVFTCVTSCSNLDDMNLDSPVLLRIL